MLTWEDDEYVVVLTTYTDVRGVLAKARIARGFYPVVVPADSWSAASLWTHFTAPSKSKSKSKVKRWWTRKRQKVQKAQNYLNWDDLTDLPMQTVLAKADHHLFVSDVVKEVI